MATTDNALTFVRCADCDVTVAGIMPAGRRLEHGPDGAHRWIEPPAPISSQAGLASFRGASRPTHRQVSIWEDVRAALEHIRLAEFHLGYLPEKPRTYDDDAVRMQLADARAVLGDLANHLADGAES